MSFKFNFIQDGDETSSANTALSALSQGSGLASTTSQDNAEVSLCEAKEISLQTKHHDLANLKTCSHVTEGGIKLSFVESCEEKASEGIKAVLKEGSDLKPYVYEGGLKIWECSHDLVEIVQFLDLDKSTVLEVGCGAGLPGITALMKGAVKVDFLDFNTEVLDLLTIPNVLLNISESERQSINKKCRFISGDWKKVKSLLITNIDNEDERYDYILTSETIYNTSSYGALLDLFKATLKKAGKIYVAAKLVYFGVGGSVMEFKDTVERDGVFTCETFKEFPAGVPREILLMKFKDV